MRILLDEDEIRRRVDALGARLTADYAGRPLTVLGVLTGGIVFVADVIRRIQVPLQLAFVRASSYRGKSTRAGALSLDGDLPPDVVGRDVLIVDDIFDTGRTLSALAGLLRERGAAGVKTAVLLEKQGRAEVAIRPDYVCFEIPDVFVVGYGLDYDGEHRHLPHIAALEDGDI